MLEAMAEPSPEGELSTGTELAAGGQGINWQTWRSSPRAQRGSAGKGSGAWPWSWESDEL